MCICVCVCVCVCICVYVCMCVYVCVCVCICVCVSVHMHVCECAFVCGWCRFHELLLQSSAEDSSETILCALDPLIEKLLSNEAQLREKNPEGGLAAAQLCSWVHGMMRSLEL